MQLKVEIIRLKAVIMRCSRSSKIKIHYNFKYEIKKKDILGFKKSHNYEVKIKKYEIHF